MAKRDITMSADEVDAFLQRCPVMVVGVIGADGWPEGTIARSSYADGVLALGFAEGDAVRAELGRDPRLCCVADEHESYFEIKGVNVLGTLTALDAVAIERVISFDFGRLR